MKFIDITGERFGRLTVIEQNGKLGDQIAWRCKCDCGNFTTVRSSSLRTGKTTSCGCFAKDIRSLYGAMKYGKTNVHPNSMAAKKLRLRTL